MSTTFLKIKEFVLRAPLPAADQYELLVLLLEMKEEDLEGFLALSKEGPEWIVAASENYKAKQAALALQDMELWKKIVAREEGMLAAIPA